MNFVKLVRTTLFTEHLRAIASGGIIFFCFSFSEKITDILKQPLGALLRCVFVWERGVLDSTKLGHTDKIRCSVKIVSFCVDIDVF